VKADSDAADASSAKEGDLSAFERIVRRWQGPLLTLAWRYCRNRDQAEDMAQEAFLKVYRALSLWRGNSRFSTWLFAIAANHYRSRMRRMSPKLVGLDDSRSNSLDLGQEQSVEQQQRTVAVHREVARLPARYRDIVILYYFHSMDLLEAASTLRLREGTAKARLHRARQLLQKRLKGKLE
jgi:RNA polymerase sigma-70 factor, ECF subfamily